MAGDPPFFIGEAIQEENNRGNGQRNDDENVVRLIRCMVMAPIFQFVSRQQTKHFGTSLKA
jgi:hypothetical protein